MSKTIELEIFVKGQWRDLAEVEVTKPFSVKSYREKGQLRYHLDYLDVFIDRLNSHGLYAASVRYPLNFGFFTEPHWPAFLLDLIPTGAARRHWLKRLDLNDGPEADCDLLAKGAINPPGNIRVKPEEGLFAHIDGHSGFGYDEVVGRGVDFIDYAENMGAIVSGTSGAQGEAPKFLLVEDEAGQWHGDGAISNHSIVKSWLIKFPRGKKQRDYEILRLEQIYYEVATELGARVFGPLLWDRDTLFIPRFDRARDDDGRTTRWGLESLISAMGVAEFGVSKKNEEYLEVIRKFSTNPLVDMKEYVFRDFLNIVMGNTDNHGRNTAFIKTENGIELSPLFDFAPMVLDDSGIPRVSKWREEVSHIPNFQTIERHLVTLGAEKDDVVGFLKEAYDKISNVPVLLKKKGVKKETLNFVTKKYSEFMATFQAYLDPL